MSLECEKRSASILINQQQLVKSGIAFHSRKRSATLITFSKQSVLAYTNMSLKAERNGKRAGNTRDNTFSILLKCSPEKFEKEL